VSRPVATDAEILARWKEEPAPLLPLLHAFQDRDGFLSESSIRGVADALRIPLADLYGTITFYHFFKTFPPGKASPRVCDGPVCKTRGADALLASLEKDGATPMPCAGRCDEPVPVLIGDVQWVGAADGTLAERETPRPAPRPDGGEECVFEHVRDPERRGLEGFLSTGGYAGLRRACGGMSSDDILGELDASGLAGRGGAGFPTGRKWRAVAEAEGGPKTIVCNADEGEPGCFKDRVLMDHDPHAVLEGMAIAARATGAVRGFIYLRYEYPHTQAILEAAIAEAEAQGFLGADVLGTGQEFRVYVRRGAGAYICGEETSLLNSLEGKHPFPRNRPPFPVTHGFEDTPTAVNNVETLCSAGPILARGADWYRGLGYRGEGHGDHPGTKVVSLSGDVQRPGNYEVPIGLPLRTLIHEWAGGPREGRTVQAVTMAGLSGGFLAGDALDVTLDEPSIRAHGSFLGAAGIMVFDDSRNMVEVAAQAMQFFAHESCGKCFPCRIGTQRLTERLTGAAGPDDVAAWKAEVADIGRTMKSTSACGLGMAAPLVAESLVRRFEAQVEAHVGEAGRRGGERA
jgi:NADH-quinone oxidoreductase subunit F